MKSFFIYLAMLIVLTTAASQLYRFYTNHVPVASEGECLNLKFEGQSVDIRITQNSVKRGESLVYSFRNGRYSSFSFEELRQLNPTKVQCK